MVVVYHELGSEVTSSSKLTSCFRCTVSWVPNEPRS